ncbi:hypothetical protein ACIBSW_13335 [Actinoplanes sp. NPDC049668]|uniref:hypothetical protein n=1 Tax=unclassified Actinoplanes TaxID=2626549 RepID=UPI0033A93E8A
MATLEVEWVPYSTERPYDAAGGATNFATAIEIQKVDLDGGCGGIRVANSLHKKILDVSSWISAARNGAWVVGALGILSAGALYLTRSVPSVRLIVAALLLIAVSAAGGFLIHRRLGNAGVSPWGYRVISIRYDFTFDKKDHGRQRQDIEIQLEAIRPNVSLFEAKYRWSGHGPARLSLQTSAQLLLTHPDMTYEGWTYYYVKLLRPLQRGERTTIKIRQDLEDVNRRMDFQLTRTVRESLDLLVLCVNFPNSGPREKDIWAVERRSALKDIGNLQRLAIDYDSSERRAELTVPDPTPGKTYAIEWTWPGYRLNKGP